MSAAGKRSAEPELTVLELSVLSHVTVFLLGELVVSIFASLRWTLAAGVNGVPFLTFVGLGPSVNFLGVVCLLRHRRKNLNTVPWLRCHHTWVLQRCLKLGISIANIRIAFNTLNLVLGFILVAKVPYKYSYDTILNFGIIQAGLPPMDVLSATRHLGQASQHAMKFALYHRTALLDSLQSIPVAPHICSGPECFSYFLPGSLTMVSPMPNTESRKPDANIYIVKDAPGYHLQFYPIATGDFFDVTYDCRLYGKNTMALQLCIKAMGNDLMAGTPRKHYVSLIDRVESMSHRSLQ